MPREVQVNAAVVPHVPAAAANKPEYNPLSVLIA